MWAATRTGALLAALVASSGASPGPGGGAARRVAAADVHTVHLIYSHHLDVGLDLPLKTTWDCVGFATKIVQRYFDSFIPRAIKIANQLRAEGHQELFKYRCRAPGCPVLPACGFGTAAAVRTAMPPAPCRIGSARRRQPTVLVLVLVLVASAAAAAAPAAPAPAPACLPVYMLPDTTGCSCRYTVHPWIASLYVHCVSWSIKVHRYSCPSCSCTQLNTAMGGVRCGVFAYSVHRHTDSMRGVLDPHVAGGTAVRNTHRACTTKRTAAPATPGG